MKSINTLNEENEKTEIHCVDIDMAVRWISFNDTIFTSGEKVMSGRGGELLKKSWQFLSGIYLEVKCSKTELTGKLYWKHLGKGIIDRIAWDDGVIKKY